MRPPASESGEGEREMSRYEPREVLADAYVRGHLCRQGPMLIHAVEVDDAGRAIRVLCRRVKLDNLADAGSMGVPWPSVTCPQCRAVTHRPEGTER